MNHRQKQLQVINSIEEQVRNSTLNFSTVAPIEDYESDTRMCLTSAHLPSKHIKQRIESSIIEPLKNIEPNFYYYPPDSLHMTIKNIKTADDPPKYSKKEIEIAHKIFQEIIPKHKKFFVYFYRLLLFPNNLALMGTTDPELDAIILELDKELKKAGIPDNKVYANSKYFFSNMTLARFNTPVSQEFKVRVEQLSENLNFDPYQVDSVTLVTCNPVLKKLNIIGKWPLN